jgi:hypothetical protein
MIAGLYAWIVLGADVQNQQLQFIERQNTILNNKQISLQNATLTNQEIIKNNEISLHKVLDEIHDILANQTNVTKQIQDFQSEEPDSNHTIKK